MPCKKSRRDLCLGTHDWYTTSNMRTLRSTAATEVGDLSPPATPRGASKDGSAIGIPSWMQCSNYSSPMSSEKRTQSQLPMASRLPMSVGRHHTTGSQRFYTSLAANAPALSLLCLIEPRVHFYLDEVTHFLSGTLQPLDMKSTITQRRRRIRSESCLCFCELKP